MAVLRKHHRPAAYEKPRFSQQEMQKLNHLVGAALTNRSICQRLVAQRDATLQSEFNLADETWQYIALIRAGSLEEFCREFLHDQVEEQAS